MEVDYRLYLVTDREYLDDVELKDAVEQAILGGTTLVQVREKHASTREFYKIALQVKSITDYYNVPIIINDRIDVAKAVDADGVHIGQSDMPLKIARKMLGHDKIIGVSAGNIKEALEAQKGGADYVGLGAAFYTGTKKDIDKPIGIDGLKKICDEITIPSVAIGGVNETNYKDVLKSGVTGISVVSAILGKKDFKRAAQNLL